MAEQHDAKRRRIDGAAAVKAESGASSAEPPAAASSDFAETFMAEQMKRMAEKMAQMERELAKAKTKAEKAAASTSSTDKPPQNFELTSDGKRRVQVRTYRGQVLIDVREFYEKDGELRPGKRGLSLKVDQWKRLVAWIPKINETIESMS
eukprot:g5137.t1